nr:unnamed protein product [Digitaria exilis]
MSRQARKETAVATRDLLKVDSARLRKTAAVLQRKDAPPPMRKVPGRGRALPVPEVGSSSWAARAPEQRSSGSGGTTPPRSFTDGSFFFNGSGGDFFGSPGQSSQPWNHQGSDPATCDG